MTPDEQDSVRRALAATPPVGPMPPEVVARLEATIAELAAARADQPAPPEQHRPDQPGAVVDLEERRRRRWPGVLVAAASVAVLAYGVGTVVPDLGPQAESADTAATDAVGGDDKALGEGREGNAGGGLAPESAPDAPDDAEPGVVTSLSAGPVLELREATLRRDVATHLRRERREVTDSAAAQDSGRRYSRPDGTCVLPDLDSGDQVVPARLDGRRATLVVRPVRDGNRVAEVYWCGDGRTLLARTVVPARR